MKDKSKAQIVAQVDVRKTRYLSTKDLGIDFANEIDIWAKMEFRFRHQINQLKSTGILENHEILRDLNSLIYAIREKVEK